MTNTLQLHRRNNSVRSHDAKTDIQGSGCFPGLMDIIEMKSSSTGKECRVVACLSST